MIKKILLTFLFSLIGGYAFGQTGIFLNGTANYKFTIEGHQGRDSNACGDTYGLRELNIIYDNGSRENLWAGRIYNQGFNHQKLYTKNKKIKGIEIYSINKWRGCWVCGCNSGPNHDRAIMSINTTCENQYNGNPVHVTRNVRVKTYPIYTINYDSSQQYKLGSEQNLKIALPDNLDSHDYIWKYSIAGGTPKIFPSSYNQKAILDIPAMEFISENDYGKIISVWVESSCTANNGIQKSNYFSFTAYKESPHITSHTISDTKCSDSDDGSVTLNFDRTLLSGETLSFSLKDSTTGAGILNGDTTSHLQNNTSYTLQNLPAGSYNLKLLGSYNGKNTYTDSNTHSIHFTIKRPDPVKFEMLSQVNVFCYKGSDGIINLIAEGGQNAYQYLVTQDGQPFLDWTDFNDGNKTSIKNLNAGLYKIKVRDSNLCVARNPNNSNEEKEISVTISQPSEAVKISSSEFEEPTGYGLSNGYISATIKGGTPYSNGSYDFEWRKDNPNGALISTGITTNVVQNEFTIKLDGITAGKYYLSVKDKNYANASSLSDNCSISSQEFIINQPDPLIANIEVEQYISCHQDNDNPHKLDLDGNGTPDEAEDAILKANVTGGVQGYTYQWQKLNNGIFENIAQATQNTLPKLGIGTYRIVIVDSKNNTTHTDITLVYPEKLEITMAANSISCHNQNSGEVSVLASGGTGSLSYEWNTMDTTPMVTGLPSGNYFVLVTDSKNCQVKGNVEITQPDQIIITDVVVQNPICHNAANGKIQVGISGGKAPHTIQWSNGISSTENNSLLAGTYTLTVTDSNGCSITKDYLLENPAPFVIDLGDDITLCLGDSKQYNISINETNASYIWKNKNGAIIGNSPTITLSEAGTYTAIVTDSKGCIAVDSVTIKNSTEVLNPQFMIGTHTYLDANVVLVNTSPTKSETVDWVVPNDPNIQIINQNEDYLELRFLNVGTYEIGLKGTQGECEKTTYKQVVVEENLSGAELSSQKTSNIKEFSIAPNPNSGSFKVMVGLEKENAISLRIINMVSHNVIPQVTRPKSTYFMVPYNTNLPAGTYLVILETGNESMVKKMIVQ